MVARRHGSRILALVYRDALLSHHQIALWICDSRVSHIIWSVWLPVRSSEWTVQHEDLTCPIQSDASNSLNRP